MARTPSLQIPWQPLLQSQTFPRWPPPQMHHCSLALCKSTRSAGLCGSPARWWPWRRWSLIFFSCWPADRDRCSPPAKSMKLLLRTPLTPAGRGYPAWSISSGASWAPASLRQCGATATASHQNSRTAPPRLYRGGAAVISVCSTIWLDSVIDSNLSLFWGMRE